MHTVRLGRTRPVLCSSLVSAGCPEIWGHDLPSQEASRSCETLFWGTMAAEAPGPQVCRPCSGALQSSVRLPGTWDSAPTLSHGHALRMHSCHALCPRRALTASPAAHLGAGGGGNRMRMSCPPASDPRPEPGPWAGSDLQNHRPGVSCGGQRARVSGGRTEQLDPCGAAEHMGARLTRGSGRASGAAEHRRFPEPFEPPQAC